MTDLEQLRDHARQILDAGHRPTCHGRNTTRWWGHVEVSPDPACDGCVPPAERALWEQIAAEVDAYLHAADDEGLF